MSIRLDWQAHAACRTVPDLFFPPEQEELPAAQEMRERSARMVCASCPVTGPCLDLAIETRDRWSISAGLDPEQRANLRRALTRQERQYDALRAEQAAQRRAEIEAAGEKPCTQCGPERGPKPLDDFGREGDGWRGTCKDCRNSGDRQRRQEMAS